VLQTWARFGQRLRSHALECLGAVLLVLLARVGGLGASMAWWVLPALAVAAVAVSVTVYTVWDGARRGVALHLRTLSQAAVLTVAAYASGAGAGLAVPLLLLGLTDTVRHAGSATGRVASGWGLAALAGAQLGVAAGIVPSLMSTSSSHAVAGVGAMLLVFVGSRIARLTAAGEHAREEAEREAGRTRALLAQASDMTLVVADARITYQSPSAERLLGYAADETLGRLYLDLVHPDDHDEVIAFVRDLIRTPRATGLVTCRLRAREGHWILFESSCRNLVEDDTVAGVVVNSRDISERRELEQQLEHRAFHDELTGLPNRALLVDRLRHTAARSRRSGGAYAVLYVDLDGFKPVNDTYGHVTGDAVLIAAGRRLAGGVRDADTLARVGGDEFAVLVECPEGPEEAVRVAERLLTSLREPLRTEARQLRVTASIGIAMGGDADDADDVLRNADIAMYRAKRAGTGRYAIFEREMHTAVARRLQLETELQRAIEQDEIVVHYQPIVRLDDGRVIALEALARWEHPERGMVSPGEFIPLAEQTGQIVPIGTAVLEKACRQLARWRRALPGTDELIVTVNVSMHQLLDVDLPADVARVLAATDLPARCLTLEITETALAHDADRARAILLRLKTLGVRIALDDFGTGYSSLAHLHRFPVDVLKIDRTFVSAHAEQGPSGRGELARAMVELGRSLDLITVAEGIEEAAELEHFRGLGCPLGQGFLFARPAAADVAGDRLRVLLDPEPDLRTPAPAGR
jgi:diguanylate cyclase (GGDEF)-like protein/PAS domain S-box-containing protein